MCERLHGFRLLGSGKSLSVKEYRLDGFLFKMEIVAQSLILATCIVK